MTSEQMMQRAVTLAQSVLSATPNPRVGCVLAHDDRVVGEGYHARAGEAHAEVNAIREAGDQAQGATAYVTLEPCFHTGKTPPCVDALIAAGVARVVYGSEDPNPKVSGQGLQKLRDAGIEIEGPVLEKQCQQINRGFIKRMTQGMPWVSCKMAMSLDGRTAMASGESKWITGADARADVQRMRASSCAVVTGVNTILSDDPSLNVREEELPEEYRELYTGRQPLRVILDSSLRTPPDSRLIGLPGQTVFLTRQPHQQQKARFDGVDVAIHELPATPANRLDLAAAMAFLADQYECNEVMLEAGPTLSGAAIQAGIVDEVVIYIGPRFLGSDALPLFHLPGIQRMQDHIALHLSDMRMIGDDFCISARIKSI